MAPLTILFKESPAIGDESYLKTAREYAKTILEETVRPDDDSRTLISMMESSLKLYQDTDDVRELDYSVLDPNGTKTSEKMIKDLSSAIIENHDRFLEDRKQNPVSKPRTGKMLHVRELYPSN